MIAPLLLLDSREQWRPVEVEAIHQVGAMIDDQIPDLHALPASGRLDFPADMQQPQDAPIVGYRRAVNAGGLWWQQFWTFWLYNPKEYVGIGAHEGDWEMVQIATIDEHGEQPILMTCSQHSGGEKREFWRVELADQQPIVYVARDSHANYFGAHRDATDQADGNGRALDDIDWREFGPWADWPGKWGNSDNSPGALSPRQAWREPHVWHSQAHG